MNEQASLNLWTKQVRLEGVKVVSERHDTPSDPVRLTLVSTAHVALCPHCRHPSDSVHRRLDSDPIRDLPHGPQTVELIFRSCQYRCEHCDRFFTPACPHVAPGAHATERFLEQAARLIRFSDIASVANFLGVPERTLERWYYDYAQRQLDKAPREALKPIKSLGIDELSLKKSTGSS
jgi:transposase